jgi:aryl-alcohol dehydrogenase-like predicted oxidoreductase
MAQEDFIFPIPGTKRIKYLEENLKAVGIKLTSEDLEEIEQAFPKNAVSGTRYSDTGMKTLNR